MNDAALMTGDKRLQLSDIVSYHGRIDVQCMPGLLELHCVVRWMQQACGEQKLRQPSLVEVI